MSVLRRRQLDAQSAGATLPEAHTGTTATAGRTAPDQEPTTEQSQRSGQAGKLKVLQRTRDDRPANQSMDAQLPDRSATATAGSSAPNEAGDTSLSAPNSRPGRLKILRRGDTKPGSTSAGQQGNTVMAAGTGSPNPAQAAGSTAFSAAHPQADATAAADEMAYSPQPSREAIRLLVANLRTSQTQLSRETYSFLWSKFDKLVFSKVRQQRTYMSHDIMYKLRETLELDELIFLACSSSALEAKLHEMELWLHRDKAMRLMPLVQKLQPDWAADIVGHFAHDFTVQQLVDAATYPKVLECHVNTYMDSLSKKNVHGETASGGFAMQPCVPPAPR